jgi:uncharacterized membrane protein YczE
MVTALALIELGCFLDTLLTNDAGSEFGWNVGTDGVTIINVEPDRPAAHAGIQPGDKIVYLTMPVFGRLNTLQNEGVFQGAVLTFKLEHRGTIRTVTMTSQPFSNLLGESYLAYAFGALAFGFVGLALVLLRPSRMTWACALIAPALLVSQSIYQWAQEAAFGTGFTFQVTLSVLYALQTFGMVSFASRFPNDAPKGVALILDRLAVPLAAVALGTYVYVDYAIFFSPVPPHVWALTLQSYVIYAATALAVFVGLLTTFASASRIDRSRLTPVIVAFVLLAIAGTFYQFAIQVSSNPAVYIFTSAFFAISCTLLAAAIAYGVIKHRVIDVNFIISHTLVYTILTLFIVVGFSLIEYVFGKVLERQGVATFLEIAAAVGLGLSLNALHGKLDNLIDRTIFRKRHIAEKRLEAASRTLPHASSALLVEELLVAEPVDALDLASAAVFRRNGASFVRESAAGWSAGDAQELDDNDHLVARLRAELEPVAISEVRWPRGDLPKGLSQPLYAVPIASGHKLAAIALYGGHSGGEDLDPDERRSLRSLAAGAALAYDHLAAESLSKTIEELRGENEALRHSNELLVDKVLKRLE